MTGRNGRKEPTWSGQLARNDDYNKFDSHKAEGLC